MTLILIKTLLIFEVIHIEIWKDLIYQGINYGQYYEISNKGYIRNSKTKKICKTYKSDKNYSIICVSLGSRKKRKCFRIHKAVAETFIPNPNNLPQVNHKDGNKDHNYEENLEWVTDIENKIHAIKHNLQKYHHGISNKNHKLSDEDVLYIREHYVPRSKEFGCRALARKYGVHHTTIIAILKKERWKHI